MAKTSGNVFVPSDYAIWTAPFGTTMPTSPAATPLGFYEVGYASDAGITESHSVNETKINDLVGKLLRTVRNQEERPFTFEAVEGSRIVSELRYGGTVTTGVGTAEVQTLTVSGTGGTFTLSGGYGGTATTSTLAFNLASSALQTAVRTLPGFATATAAGTAGGPYTVTFPAAVGDVAQMTVDPTLLVGGGATLATTTPGVAPINTRPVGSGTSQNLRAWVIYLADGNKHKMFTIPNGEAVWTGTVGYTGSSAAISQFTLQPYPDNNGNYFVVIDDNPAQAATVAYA